MSECLDLKPRPHVFDVVHLFGVVVQVVLNYCLFVCLCVLLTACSYRCGNVAAIFELDENLQKNYTIFEAAPHVSLYTHTMASHHSYYTS